MKNVAPILIVLSLASTAFALKISGASRSPSLVIIGKAVDIQMIDRSGARSDRIFNKPRMIVKVEEVIHSVNQQVARYIAIDYGYNGSKDSEELTHLNISQIFILASGDVNSKGWVNCAVPANNDMSFFFTRTLDERAIVVSEIAVAHKDMPYTESVIVGSHVLGDHLPDINIISSGSTWPGASAAIYLPEDQNKNKDQLINNSTFAVLAIIPILVVSIMIYRSKMKYAASG